MHRRYARLGFWLGLVLMLGAAAIAPVHVARNAEPAASPVAAASPATGKIVLVEIVDFAFVPARVEVTVGDTVRWKNLDMSPHSVISDEDEEPLDSGRLDRGAGFRRQFDQPGVFNYECGYHQNMGGIVIVHPAGDGTPVAAA